MRESNAKKNRFPKKLFAIYLGVLLLMSGIHTGIVIYMNYLDVYEGIQAFIPIVYWGLIAAVLTSYTRKQIIKVYEMPLQEFAAATEKVAEGDFSVYVPTVHSPDQYDYYDHMILDFNKMVENLGSIETLKTDFISNVSHEMKTPIAQIQNYAQLLQKEDLSDEKRMEYAKIIQESSVRMSSLITNILKLNKLENQMLIPEKKRYDVCQQLCDCIFALETRFEEKEIELDTNLDERIFINADASLLELVWNNLLTNAIKFSDVGGKIEIKQEENENEVIISVKDHGCGMSHETAAHIFDKFYQGDTSHAAEGNGLGLALVYRVITLMDAEIWVESKENIGSTFFVKLIKD